jgi:homogentisate 1,2-dioxygenase
MSIDNLPEEPEEIIDIAAKAGYLKVKTELGDIKLNSHNSVEIQPRGTLFGVKAKVESDGSITPTLTFDTKKLREPKKNIDAKQMLDDALEDFLNEQI